jgi:hypothetical protein
MLQHHAGLQAAYRDAGMVLADGAPVLWSSRLLHRAGQELPERVAGSDLVPALFNAVTDERPLTVYLLGAAPGVADRAAVNIHRQWPGVEIVGSYSPPLGFERNETENESIGVDALGRARMVLSRRQRAPPSGYSLRQRRCRLSSPSRSGMVAASPSGSLVEFLDIDAKAACKPEGVESPDPFVLRRIRRCQLHDPCAAQALRLANR